MSSQAGLQSGRERSPSDEERGLIAPHFDDAWYRTANPDIAEVDVDVLDHYLEHGWREGRAPSAMFDPSAYLRVNPDVAEAGIEPLGHYLRYGRTEGRALRLPGESIPAEAFVRALYRTIMAREADPIGLDYHLESITRTGNVDGTILAFLNSWEHQRAAVKIVPEQAVRTGARRSATSRTATSFAAAANRRTAQLRTRDAVLTELLDRPLAYQPQSLHRARPRLGLHGLYPQTGLFETLVDGWSQPEPWVVWSGPTAILEMLVEPGILMPAAVAIDLRAPAQRGGAQQIEVLADGRVLASRTLTGLEPAAELAVKVPPDLGAPGGVLRLTLRSAWSGERPDGSGHMPGVGLRGLRLAH